MTTVTTPHRRAQTWEHWPLQFQVAIQFTTVLQALGPGENAGDGVGAGGVALAKKKSPGKSKSFNHPSQGSST